MTFTSEKYKPLDDFDPKVPEPDLRSCLIWLIATVVLFGIVFAIAAIIKK